MLLTLEHVKRVLNVEVQKADSLLLSLDRYSLEMKSLTINVPVYYFDRQCLFLLADISCDL